jgi:hypothetical protein
VGSCRAEDGVGWRLPEQLRKDSREKAGAKVHWLACQCVMVLRDKVTLAASCLTM